MLSWLCRIHETVLVLACQHPIRNGVEPAVVQARLSQNGPCALGALRGHYPRAIEPEEGWIGRLGASRVFPGGLSELVVGEARAARLDPARVLRE